MTFPPSHFNLYNKSHFHWAEYTYSGDAFVPFCALHAPAEPCFCPIMILNLINYDLVQSLSI